MQRYVFGAIAVTVMAGAVVCGQSVTPPDAPSALALLERVAQHYAYAKSYHIESSRENTISNDLAREWRKTILSAAESSGNRYRYEGHTGFKEVLLDIATYVDTMQQNGAKVSVLDRRPIRARCSGPSGRFCWC